MKFHKPTSLTELFEIIERINDKIFFLAGGTDLNVQIKKGMITNASIVYINHLTELKGIHIIDDQILLGALTSYGDLLDSQEIKLQLPYFSDSLTYFASPLLQTMATIGGNLANGSPTADITPLLLVLNAQLKLLRKSKMRIISVSEFYKGYKKFNLKPNEIIGAILIPKNAEKGFITYYNKVGSRKSLTIAKVSIAAMKKVENNIIKEVRIAAGALNEFPRRLPLLEKYLTNKTIDNINHDEIMNCLKSEITPISDLRSDKEYRFEVAFNLIKEFLDK